MAARRSKTGCRAITGIPGVFAAGRLWDEAKGLATLDEAASRMTAPVAVAGPLAGPGGQAPVPRHLRCLGSLSEPGMARWMADAAVYGAPARYEPFGLGVLEAAQAGCALVLADIPSFRELWSGAAVFVPVGDARALAEALDGVVWDRPRRQELAEAARDRSRAYGLDAMAEGMLAAYGAALAGSSRGAAA
jgi:glycosyltransferase involved in cell wall biosynthesis